MQPLPPWMVRDNPCYDPNRIGAISQAKIIAALVAAGKIVLLPWCQVLRYDLVIEEEGRFFRVQCKTGHICRGAVAFPTRSVRTTKGGTTWRLVARDYQGEVDYFGVYCPENGAVYLVPIGEMPTKSYGYLRVEPAKNNQQKNIRWAKDYEVKPLSLNDFLLH